jgi:hypothetical protein
MIPEPNWNTGFLDPIYIQMEVLDEDLMNILENYNKSK